MSRSKKVLFYCIMAVMTLAVIEGMAQAAYYIAYGEVNQAPLSGPGPAVGGAVTPWSRLIWRASHPYYGFTQADAASDINRFPPPRREDGVVLIALLGGSVSRDAADAFRRALEAWFQEHDIPARPVLVQLAYAAFKQPQQVIQIANTLAIGAEYDIIVNLDGYNELNFALRNYFENGLFPFYPHYWELQHLGSTDTEKLVASRIYALRQREQQLAASAAARPWRWSAFYGIVHRYLRESAAAQIADLNHELDAADSSEYRLRRYGPALDAATDEYELSRMAARVWYRSSVLLAELSRAAGAEYYHFHQPNQYVPDSKPFSDQELARAIAPDRWGTVAYRDAYPLLLRLGDELRRQGINYYDLTQIFADNLETLYIDACCHLNKRGSELLAASMVQRLAPTLRNRAALAAARVGGGGEMTAGTALDPAAQESSPVHAVNKLYFDVRLSDDDGTLRYSRDDCRPADVAAPFFVRIAPVDAADLLPGGAASGYNSDDFSFDQDGGMLDAAGRCVVEYRLPEYDIAHILTGQHNPETGEMRWRARITLDFGFAVEHTAAGALRYSRANCLPVHIGTDFFLHITPADNADLLPGRVEHGYNNADFSGFSRNDELIDAAGRCVMEMELPDYNIARILTGQYIPATGRRLWETRIDFEQP